MASLLLLVVAFSCVADVGKRGLHSSVDRKRCCRPIEQNESNKITFNWWPSECVFFSLSLSLSLHLQEEIQKPTGKEWLQEVAQWAPLEYMQTNEGLLRGAKSRPIGHTQHRVADSL